jgi:hypothetical protein
MNQYVPIKTLCEQTGLCEKTIRRLIRTHGMPHHRNSPKGKILVEVSAFERYMRSTRISVQKDQTVIEVLREFRDFARAVR